MVSIVTAKDYGEAQAAVDKTIANLGGLAAFFEPSQRVLIKPNLLGKHSPDKAATTHPAVIEALARRLVEFGCEVTIGDSPAGAYAESKLSPVYRVTGMAEAATKSGAALNFDFGTSEVDYGGVMLKKSDIIDIALKFDAVVNFCKLKTHGYTGYSGAVKNLFGVIPGRIKIQMHAVYTRIDDFCDALIDIERFLVRKTVLHFMDAIVGMDGAGPLDGNPHFVGCVLASPDPYLCDLAALQIVGAKKDSMPVLYKAAERGLLDKAHLDNTKQIETIGEKIADIDTANKYKNMPVQLHEPISARVPKPLQKTVYKLLTKYPKLKRKKLCKGCKKCIDHCPVDAIELKKNGKVKFDLIGCIRCFCCQELCEYHAIKIKTPLLYKTMRK